MFLCCIVLIVRSALDNETFKETGLTEIDYKGFMKLDVVYGGKTPVVLLFLTAPHLNDNICG